MNIVSMQQNNG